MKLPVSFMLADVTPALQVFDIQTVLSRSIRTRLPVGVFKKIDQPIKPKKPRKN